LKIFWIFFLYPHPTKLIKFNLLVVDKQLILIHYNGRLAVMNIVRDITERKQAEKALRLSEEKFRRITDNAIDIIFRLELEPEVRMSYVNQCVLAITGFSQEEYLISGDELVQKVHPDDREKSIKLLNDKVIPDVPIVLRWLRKDEGFIWMETRIVPVYDEKMLMIAIEGISRDITSYILALEALKESEDKFRTLAEASPYAIMIYQQDKWVYTNPAGLRICEYTEEEIYSMKFWDIIGPEYRESIQKIGKARQSGQLPDASYELFIVTKYGYKKWVYLTGSSLIYKGMPAGIISAVDITDRKMAENEVKREKLLLRTLIDNLPDTIYVKDHEARKILANKADLEIMGVQSESEIIGKNDIELYNEPTGNRGYTDDLKILRTGKPILNQEEDFIDIHNEKRYLLTSKIPLYNEKRDVIGLIGIGRDITTRMHSELALMLSEEKHRTLFENMAQGVVYQDENGSIISVNPATEKILGVPAKKLTGKSTMDLFNSGIHEDGTAYASESHPAAIALRTGKPVRNKIMGIFNPVRKQNVWIKIDATPQFRSKSKQPYQVFTTFDNITDRKQIEIALKDSEQRYRSLFNVMTEGFALHEIILDDNDVPVDYRFLTVNPAFEKITGLRAIDILGKTVKEVLPGIEYLWIEKYGKVALTGKAVRFENFSADLNRYYSVVAFSPKKYHFATMFSDITDRRIAEEEVRKLNTELEERVLLRTTELEKSVQEMESFAYSVSHDLRSPLRAIDGFSQILVDEYSDKFDQEGWRVLNVIRENTKKMDQLISDLLALSRISRVEFSASSIDMSSLVNTVIQEFTTNKVISADTIIVKELLPVMGDHNLLRQVWINLIDNAIKYSRNHPDSKVEIGSYREDKSNVFYVRDEGVGFNPAYSHKLFGVFQRLHKASEFEGSGVGLAIVQRIIIRHHGKVWAESKPGNGATFYFSLPAD
jgi:PAS domain S-box-containing protein